MASAKVWAQLGREGGVAGRPVARCTVARLMKAAGLRGVSRVKAPRTTIRAAGPDPRPDLVDRAFTAPAPNRLWVADITYVKTHSGWVYASFVLDVFSRWIVGWQLSTNLYTDLALDALNMGIWTRQRNNTDLSQLIHHSDRGVQYLAIRYTERLHEVEAVASVGSVGDSYDCETVLRRSGRCDPCYEWPFGCLGVDLSAGSSDAPQVARRAGSDLIGA
jgi:putative transposase